MLGQVRENEVQGVVAVSWEINHLGDVKLLLYLSSVKSVEISTYNHFSRGISCSLLIHVLNDVVYEGGCCLCTRWVVDQAQ